MQSSDGWTTISISIPFRSYTAPVLLLLLLLFTFLFWFRLFFFGQWSHNTLDSWPTTCKGPPAEEQHQRASVTDVAAP